MELVVIIHALKLWCRYLIGRRLAAMTNHSGLKYLFDQPHWNTKQARWLGFLSEFDFEIKHIKGKENKGEYVISRSMKVIYMTMKEALMND